MTREEAIKIFKHKIETMERGAICCDYGIDKDAFAFAIHVLEQKPIDRSAMMHEIYMEGVNMTGEYQGCWVRFKNIEKIVDKYMAESEENK